jgi:hypothetical protein
LQPRVNKNSVVTCEVQTKLRRSFGTESLKFAVIIQAASVTTIRTVKTSKAAPTAAYLK